MSDQILNDLRSARAVIEQPSRWTKDTTARTARGDRTYAGDSDAVSWCAEGALLKVCICRSTSRFNGAWNAMNRASGRDFVVFNDDRATTHADVLALYDRAIAQREASNV